MQEISSDWQFLPVVAAELGLTRQLPPVADLHAMQANGGSLTGTRFKPSEAPEFLLLHGAGLYAHCFDGVALLLDSPLAVFDLPGHGNSAWLQDADYSPARLAAELEPAVATLATSPTAQGRAAAKPVLVGHSLGGLTALHITAKRPELFCGVVIIDITPDSLGTPGSKQVAEFITGKREFSSRAEMVARAIEFGLGTDPTTLMRGVTLNSRQRTDGKFEWRHHFAHLDGIQADQTPAQLAAATDALWQAASAVSSWLPLTLLVADAGMVDAAQVKRWQELVPGSTIHQIAGSHNLHDSNPQALAAALQASQPRHK